MFRVWRNKIWIFPGDREGSKGSSKERRYTKWRCIEQDVSRRTHGLSPGVQSAGWLTRGKGKSGIYLASHLRAPVAVILLRLLRRKLLFAKFRAVNIKGRVTRILNTGVHFVCSPNTIRNEQREIVTIYSSNIVDRVKHPFNDISLNLSYLYAGQ